MNTLTLQHDKTRAFSNFPFSFAWALTWIFVAYVAGNALALAAHSSSLPTSDYFQFLFRYERFLKGEMSLPSFLLTKHVDHNHFLVYLFSWLDASLAGGNLRLLTIGQALSHVAFFVLCVYVMRFQRPHKYLGLVGIAFCASQIFSIYGMEIWVFPFQFVLASFRALFAIGFLLFCKDLLEPEKRQQAFVFYLPLLLVASLSHGSGVLVPIAVMVALVFARYVGPIRLNRVEWSFLLVFFLAFAAHAHFFPSESGFTKILHWIRTEEWARIPVYLGFLLGHAFAWSAPYKMQVLAGAFGITAYLALLMYFFIKRFRSGLNIGLVVLGGFYLGSAALSILLNLGYADIRGVKTISPEYFLSSRYLATTSGFWIALLFLSFSWVSAISRPQVKTAGAAVIGICFFVSSCASLYVYGFGSKEDWKNLLHYQTSSARYIRSWGFGPDTMSAKEFSERFFIPVGMYAVALPSVTFAKEQKLGIFSPGRHDLDAPDQTPLSLTDSNWEGGVSRSKDRIVVTNLKSNHHAFAPCTVLDFRTGPRTIRSQQIAGAYLNLILSGPPLNPALDGYPQRFAVSASSSNAMSTSQLDCL